MKVKLFRFKSVLNSNHYPWVSISSLSLSRGLRFYSSPYSNYLADKFNNL